MRYPGNDVIKVSAGVSLVELMIALLLTSLLVAGIGQVFLVTGRSYRVQDNLGRLQENGRHALGTLQADLRRAGYLGVIKDIGSIVDNTAGGKRNGHRLAVDDGQCRDIDWVRSLSHPVFGKDDHRRGYDCLPRTKRHTGDILVTRYITPLTTSGNTAGTAQSTLRPDHFYLRASLSTGNLFAGRDAAANPPGGAAARMAELVARAYFIRTRHAPANTGCPGGRTLPALYRLVQANGKLVSEEVARGIEQFQVQYGIDGNGNGSIDRFIDAMDAQDPRWQQLVAVRIWLLVRAECPETGYDNSHRYVMGNISVDPARTDRDGDGVIDGDVDGDGNDDYRRRLFTGTVALRNS